MSDINPDALSLEDAGPDTALDGPPITPSAEPATQQDDAAEPEGVVEHAGQRMVPVSVLAAERRRVREVTERHFREKELTPLQRAAEERDQLRAVLAEVRPIVEDARRFGVNRPKPSTSEDAIPDEDAAAEARDLELYDPKTGQPDLVRAKRIIARRRQEAMTAASAAAQAAVGPITSQTASSQSRQNFAEMAMQPGADGQVMAPPGSAQAKLLAELWVSLPPELTAHREVAELVRDAALGKHLRTTGRVPRAERGPTFSEPAGGRSGPQWEMDRMAKSLAKNAGISDAEFKKTAQGYQPGGTNVLGE